MTSPILLISSGLTHPSALARLFLRRVLTTGSAHRLHQVRSLEALPQSSLGSYGALVLDVHHERVSSSALMQLDGYVARGGGLLALHAASASYTDQAQWPMILGGRFREHGPVESFRVEPTLEADEIFAGISSFSIRDELYRHDYEPHCRVHFATRVNGNIEPVVWTKYWGAGRICYCSLGHMARSIRHPQVREVLGRGLDWVFARSAQDLRTG